MVRESDPSKKVCVIGAGPSGLVAAREIRKEGHNVVVLEQNHDVGGQWLYNPKVEHEDHLEKGNSLKVHSSIYNSCRLVSPREAMGYSDFPFIAKEGRDTRRFPGHKECLLYLKDFTEHFALREMIKFNTKVEHVEMLDYGEFGKELRWVVKSKDEESKKMVEEMFDAVVVATGHYSRPKLPSVKGMGTWKRKQMHSHAYRVPEPFRDEVVLVIGNSQSGRDIATELVNVAKCIHISAKSLDNISEGLSKLLGQHPTIHLHPLVESLHEDGRVDFIDGSCLTPDTIIYATGYSYSFPFLDTQTGVVVDEDRVTPLFEHTFPPTLAPSLSFIGIPKAVIGFPFFESQAKWVAQLLSGKTKLPSQDEMIKSVKEFYHSKDAAGIPKHYTHWIANHEYCDKYADYSGYPHLEEWRKSLIDSARVASEVNLNFRDELDDEEMVQVAYQSSHFTQLVN